MIDNEVGLETSPPPALDRIDDDKMRLMRQIIDDSESLFREFAQSVKGDRRQNIEINQSKRSI